MEENRVASFPPIVDERSKVLLLGTMPGAESLRQQRYYAYGRNHFWQVIFALYEMECPQDYEKRILFLLEKRIAVWDVLASCERRGSADAEIRNPEPNRIPELLHSHPGIAMVFMNGNGAAGLYRKLVLPRLTRSLPIEALPSTSPAYAIPFERKLNGWKSLKGFLDNLLCI